MKKLLLMLLFTVSILSYGGEKVVVYAPSSMGGWLEEAVAEDFKAKTGVEVEFVGIKGMLTRMKLEKRRPKADIVLGLSQANVMEAKKEDLVASYKPENADKISRDEFIIDDEWYTTPFDYGSLAINANIKGIDKLPGSFEEMKGLKGQLIVPSPNSFTGQEFMMWTVAVYGEKWKEFWTELKPAIRTVTPGWNEAWAKFTVGEVPLMAGYATSDLYFEEGSSYKSFIPEEGGYIYIQGASLVNKSEIKDGAKLFMEYILDDNFQRAMAEKNYMLPVTDLELGDEYMRVPTSSKIVTVSDKDLARVEEYKKELIELLRK